MEINTAIKPLSAMAHDGRLTLLRRLIQAGPDGVGVGDLAKYAKVRMTTASAQLAVLDNAGLVQAQRHGRQVIYRADYKTLGDLMQFLLHDCCQGRDEIVCCVSAQVQNAG